MNKLLTSFCFLFIMNAGAVGGEYPLIFPKDSDIELRGEFCLGGSKDQSAWLKCKESVAKYLTEVVAWKYSHAFYNKMVKADDDGQGKYSEKDRLKIQEEYKTKFYKKWMNDGGFLEFDRAFILTPKLTNKTIIPVESLSDFQGFCTRTLLLDDCLDALKTWLVVDHIQKYNDYYYLVYSGTLGDRFGWSLMSKEERAQVRTNLILKLKGEWSTTGLLLNPS